MSLTFWNETPALRLSLFFIIGIIGGFYSPYSASNHLIFGLFGLNLAIWLISFKIQSDWKRIKVQSIFGYISFVLLGFLIINFKLNTQNQIVSEFTKPKEYKVLAQVTSTPLEKEKTYKIDFNVIGLYFKDSTKFVPHKCIVYVTKDSLSANLKPGQYLLLNTKLNKFESPINFGNVDFSKIYRNKNILSTAYLPADKWSVTSIEKKSFNNFILSWRLKIKSIIHKNISSNNAKSILNALLLGEQSTLDQQVKSILVDAGIIHILAVSGLHVGIIYLLFNFLTYFIKKRKHRFLKLAIVLFGIWMFVLLTGVPPSAFRAAIMFTLFAIGKNLNFQSNSFNIIGASALIILMINPLLIFDAGFQLSYSAVLGIIVFQRPIYSSLNLGNNKVIDYGWSLISVSIAATLGTLAIVLFNFNRFPTYFILTNLTAIPIATVLLVAGIGLILLSPIPFITKYIGLLIEYCTDFLIFVSENTQSLPVPVIKNLYPDVFQTLILAFIIITMGIIIKFRTYNFKLISTILSLTIIGLAYTLVIKYNHIHQNELIISQIKNSRVLVVNSGLKSYHFIQYKKKDNTEFETRGLAKLSHTNLYNKEIIDPNYNYKIQFKDINVETFAKNDTIRISQNNRITKVSDSKNKYEIDNEAFLLKW